MNTNTKNNYLEQIKFYADTPRGERNKFFCYTCSIVNYEEFFLRFILRGYAIRAAYYNQTNINTGEIRHNLKFKREDLQTLFDKAMQLPDKEKQRIRAFALKK